MPDEVRIAGAFALGLGIALVTTPAAIGLAARMSFYDKPAGYKQHSAPTPYLGGLAVVAAFLIAALLFNAGDELVVIPAGALLLLLLGTIDDRIALGPLPRLAAEILLAIAIWALDVGWVLFDSDLVNLLLTVLWVVGLVNAFNLMDNLDGAAGTVASVCAAGTGAYAIVGGEIVIAVLMFAVAGACLGFLRYNLARPARVFLGDGGSMPLGFAIAAAIMAVRPEGGPGIATILAAIPLVGLPVLDTALVTFSRARRGTPIWDGGRDHLTHRLLGWLGSPREVALVLAAAQCALCALGVVLLQQEIDIVLPVAMAYCAVGVGVVTALEWNVLAPGHRREY